MNKCSKCGANAEETEICINMRLADVNFPVWQCSNKECSWHVQKAFYLNRNEWDKYKKENPREAKYIEVLLERCPDHSYSWDEKSCWNRRHKSKKKKDQKSSCNKEKVGYTNNNIERNILTDMEI